MQEIENAQLWTTESVYKMKVVYINCISKVFSSRHLLLEYKYDGGVALPGVQVQEQM